jgi:hypothetical protein
VRRHNQEKEHHKQHNTTCTHIMPPIPPAALFAAVSAAALSLGHILAPTSAPSSGDTRAKLRLVKAPFSVFSHFSARARLDTGTSNRLEQPLFGPDLGKRSVVAEIGQICLSLTDMMHDDCTTRVRHSGCTFSLRAKSFTSAGATAAFDSLHMHEMTVKKWSLKHGLLTHNDVVKKENAAAAESRRLVPCDTHC